MHPEESGSYEKGVAFMFIYAFVLALLGLLSKIVLTDDGLFVFLFSRYFFSLLAFLPFLFWFGGFHQVSFGPHLYPMIGRAFIGMLSLNLFFYCLIRTSLFNATVLYNTGPIFIPLIVKWKYGAEVNKSVWWSIALAFLGVLLVMKPNSGIFSIYSIAGLSSGFLMALSSTLAARVNMEGAKISLIVFYFLLLASFFSGLAFLAFNGLYKKDLPAVFDGFFYMPWQGWGAMGATVICLLINQVARGFAFRFAPIEKLAPFMYSVIVFSGIFDWVIFNHPPQLLSLVGGLLVVSGIFLELYFQKKFKAH